jgi:hypothetical protein
MIKEQTMTAFEIYEKVSIPMEHRPELSEKDQNRLALEKFENSLSEKGKLNLKILRRPSLATQNERVVLVFSIFLEIPDNSVLPVPELQKQIKTAYFDVFPDEWDLSYINRKIAA